jgi:hypothetical protein
MFLHFLVNIFLEASSNIFLVNIFLVSSYLGVSEKPDGIPEHERDRTVNTFKDSGNTKGDQESPTSGTNFQSFESIYRCPRTPLLYGDEWTFTFRKHPRTRRIFLMWTHTWMSFSSHTFTSLPLVHTLNPDFLGRQLWLCFSLVREFPCSWLQNQTSDRFLNFPLLKFVTSPVRDSRLSHVHDSESSQVQDSWKSRIRDPEASPVRDSWKSHVRDSEASRIQDSWKSRMLCPWKTHHKNFVKLDVSRVTGFPEFPNTSPSGKRVDSDDPIPRKSEFQ